MKPYIIIKPNPPWVEEWQGAYEVYSDGSVYRNKELIANQNPVRFLEMLKKADKEKKLIVNEGCSFNWGAFYINHCTNHYPCIWLGFRKDENYDPEDDEI